MFQPQRQPPPLPRRYLTFEGVIPKRAVQRASFFVQYTHDISLAMHKST